MTPRNCPYKVPMLTNSSAVTTSGEGGTRKYRLEVGVKRLTDLVDMSSSARIVFSVRLPHFPEIYIQPQVRGGGAAVEFSPAGDRVLSVTYNACHRAEFSLSNRDCRTMFPTQCCCRLYDESLSEVAIASSSLTWLCPCPLVEQQVAKELRCSNFEMRTVGGKVMGVAEMTCRVVPVECAVVAPVSPSPVAPVNSTPIALTGSSDIISIDGKAYVIRVIIDSRIFKRKGKRKVGTTHRHRSKRKEPRIGGQPAPAIAAPPAREVLRPDEGEVLPREALREVKQEGQDLHASSHMHEGAMEGVQEGTFLYFLKYDVAYQIQSNCMMFYTTLKREFATLDEFTIDDKARNDADRIERLAQNVLRLSNIVLQLATQFVTSAGFSKAEITVRENCGTSVEKLPPSKKGSVADFIVNKVLYQLQTVGANLYHIALAYPKPLVVSLSSLTPQHTKFMKDLAMDIKSLTKRVNIMVQSTVNGNFGVRGAFSKVASTTTRRSSRSSGDGIPGGRERIKANEDVTQGQIINESTAPRRKPGIVATGEEKGSANPPEVETSGGAKKKKADSSNDSSSTLSTSRSRSVSTGTASSSSLSDSGSSDQSIGSSSKSSTSYTDSFTTTQSTGGGSSTVESIPSTRSSKRFQPTVIYTPVVPNVTLQPQSCGEKPAAVAPGGVPVPLQSIPLALSVPPFSSTVGVPQPAVAVSSGNPLPTSTAPATTAPTTTSATTTTSTTSVTATQSPSQSATSIPAVAPVALGAPHTSGVATTGGLALSTAAPSVPIPVAPATVLSAGTSTMAAALSANHSGTSAAAALPVPLISQLPIGVSASTESVMNVAASSMNSSIPLPTPVVPVIRSPTTPTVQFPPSPGYSARGVPTAVPAPQAADANASLAGPNLSFSILPVPAPKSPTAMPQPPVLSSAHLASPPPLPPSARVSASASLSLSTPGKGDSVFTPLPLPSLPSASPVSPSSTPEGVRGGALVV